uniref:Uncharacterized protein n=1 Tax=Cacopsylla melanoneura TaxID=428564 RepID=A0A8D8QT34_9HEMI
MSLLRRLLRLGSVFLQLVMEKDVFLWWGTVCHGTLAQHCRLCSRTSLSPVALIQDQRLPRSYKTCPHLLLHLTNVISYSYRVVRMTYPISTLRSYLNCWRVSEMFVIGLRSSFQLFLICTIERERTGIRISLPLT